MNFTLYDYQSRGVELGVEATQRLLLAAPTGCGKSIIERELLAAIPGSILVTPSVEIIDGLEDKGADRSRLWTPIKLRNALLDGRVDPPPAILWDEAHHVIAESWQQVAMSCDSRQIGFTATPYRGTPKGTVDFRMYWGDPVWLIKYPEAIDAGYIVMPECSIEPLVDDDLIEVTASGEFDVHAIEAVTGSKISDFASLVDSFPLDRPTMLSLTTRELCRMVAERLKHPWRIVDGDTPRESRREAFEACLQCRAVLIQINVVSEGVDLPIRRLIDAAPTMSPVRWVQLFGRGMRPCKTCGVGRRCDCGLSQYIGTNRNLMRHSYAIQGVMPTAKLIESQEAFGGGSIREGCRVVGLEGLGRFKPNVIRLESGLESVMYQLETRDVETGGLRQYCCITHPASEQPLWATRLNRAGNYGRWQRCEPPVAVKGFASGKATQLSDKQRAWWERDAARYGLDPNPENVTRRTFAALPVLTDVGARIL